jgi:N-acetylmuramoyl-L-alanine amidase
MKFINTYKSPNYNNRKKNSKIKFLIIHYTALKNDLEAINYMCDHKNKVSSHYLINKKGEIYCLVNENLRAWHAGVSFWKRTKDINSYSIGIEMDNSGHHHNFENYTSSQTNSLINLLIFLKKKYEIKFDNILGHSDIAPYRKIDPGEKFPWKKLANKSIINNFHKIKKEDIKNIEYIFKKKLFKSKKQKVLYVLRKIGYDIENAKNNTRDYKKLITIYQMKFLKNSVSGIVDRDTYNYLISHYNHCLTS